MEVVNLDRIVAVPYGLLRAGDALNALRTCPTCKGKGHDMGAMHVVSLHAVHRLCTVWTRTPDGSHDGGQVLQVTTLMVDSGECTRREYTHDAACPVPVRLCWLDASVAVVHEMTHVDDSCPNWYVAYSMDDEGFPHYEALTPHPPQLEDKTHE